MATVTVRNESCGKGSRYRPVDQRKFRANFDRIFGKKKRRPRAPTTRTTREPS